MDDEVHKAIEARNEWREKHLKISSDKLGRALTEEEIFSFDTFYAPYVYPPEFIVAIIPPGFEEDEESIAITPIDNT